MSYLQQFTLLHIWILLLDLKKMNIMCRCCINVKLININDGNFIKEKMDYSFQICLLFHCLEKFVILNL